ncbi:MAG: hypothetical protein KAX65_10150 [Caldilineaceae bacterium]|nr:hypothetical protein [Caldilineaceae bacterium]
MALILKHQTPEAFIARVRQAYRDGDSERLVKIARFLIARVQAGDVTEAQLRSAFGMNVTKWNALKTRMQSLITADNAVKAAVGE